MTIPIQDLSFTKRPSGSASMHVTYDKYDIWFEGYMAPMDEIYATCDDCLKLSKYYDDSPELLRHQKQCHESYVDIEVTIDNLPGGSFTFTQYRDGTEITPEMMLDVLNEFIQHTKQVVSKVKQ